MSDEPEQRFAGLPPETQAFLTRLSADDIKALEVGIPIFKRIIGFGQEARWLAIAALASLAGIVLLGESVAKILSWFRTP
jgi:hypothetical protein